MSRQINDKKANARKIAIFTNALQYNANIWQLFLQITQRMQSEKWNENKYSGNLAATQICRQSATQEWWCEKSNANKYAEVLA